MSQVKPSAYDKTNPVLTLAIAFLEKYDSLLPEDRKLIVQVIKYFAPISIATGRPPVEEDWLNKQENEVFGEKKEVK